VTGTPPSWTGSAEDYERHLVKMREAARDRKFRTQREAVMKHEPWSKYEDELLLSSPKETEQLALELARTYSATAYRRSLLRKAQLSTAAIPVQILCPCGSIDGDHDKWCPQFKES